MIAMSAIYRTDDPPGPAGRWFIDHLETQGATHCGLQRKTGSLPAVIILGQRSARNRRRGVRARRKKKRRKLTATTRLLRCRAQHKNAARTGRDEQTPCSGRISVKPIFRYRKDIGFPVKLALVARSPIHSSFDGRSHAASASYREFRISAQTVDLMRAESAAYGW